MILFGKGRENDKLNLFSLLGKDLERDGQEVGMLAFNLSEKYIYKKYNCNVIDVKKYKKIQKSQNYTIEEIEDIIYYESQIKDIDNEKLKEISMKFLKILEIIHTKKRLKLCVIWNTSFLFDRALYRFCQKNNIKYLVLENGYFRPLTLAIDKKGVNYDSSIKEEYLKLRNQIQFNRDNFEKNLYKDTFYKNVIKRQYSVILFYFFRIIDKVLYYKQNLFFDISETGLLNHIKKIKKNKKIKNKLLDEEYIFIPFQVESDSQIILNSSKIKKMKDLFDVVSKSVQNLNIKNDKSFKCIFKTHPSDKNLNLKEILYLKKKYKNSEIITEGNTKELIANSKLVITINSTVGIEALVEKKQVLTLGEAFYNIENIAKYCGDAQELEKNIELFMNKDIDEQEVQNFLYYLRFYYSEEIDWRKPDIISIRNITKKILKYKNYE